MRGILAPAGPKPATQTDHPLVDSLYGVVALDAEIQLYDSMLPADRGGQHMGPRLGWSMIPDHQILLWRFERMQSNANWFAGQIDAMGIADVRRATFDGGSTFLYAVFGVGPESRFAEHCDFQRLERVSSIWPTI